MTKNGADKDCERCGKSYYASASTFKTRRFCSQTCSNKTTNTQVIATKRKQSIERVATSNKKWRYTYAYETWRKQVFSKDGYECQSCGSEKSLIAHHIKSYNEYPELRIDVSNGTTLCRPCHNRHDKGIVATQF